MRSYERNRVLVDQCTGCGGLFLDRGELEALVAAETAWHQPPAAQPAPGPQDRAPQPYAAAPGSHATGPGAPTAYQQPPAQHYGSAPYAKYSKHYGKRRRSFLSELFDD